ncbi:hypothetical protein KR054_008806 [Drosophila jambulina]|nr:hypothetical protein KR054_008806 [Drosophila jambulina]
MTNSLAIVAFVASLWLCLFGQLQAASIVCGSEAKALDGDLETLTTTPSPSEVNKFVHSLQCTLEKAKPWIANIEKEAKILEEKARDVTRSLFQRFNMLVTVLTLPANPHTEMDKIKDPEEVTTSTSTSISTTEPEPEPEPSSSLKNEIKEEMTTSSPPVRMDWLEDHDNEVV